MNVIGIFKGIFLILVTVIKNPALFRRETPTRTRSVISVSFESVPGEKSKRARAGTSDSPPRVLGVPCQMSSRPSVYDGCFYNTSLIFSRVVIYLRSKTDVSMGNGCVNISLLKCGVS